MANASAKTTEIKLLVKASGRSVIAPDIAAPEYPTPKPAPRAANPIDIPAANAL